MLDELYKYTYNFANNILGFVQNIQINVFNIYFEASATCNVSINSLFSRSAMVREIFKILL